MVGRYVVEIMMVVLCGMGLHSTEVAQVRGSEVFVQFNEVSHNEWHLFDSCRCMFFKLTLPSAYICGWSSLGHGDRIGSAVHSQLLCAQLQSASSDRVSIYYHGPMFSSLGCELLCNSVFLHPAEENMACRHSGSLRWSRNVAYQCQCERGCSQLLGCHSSCFLDVAHTVIEDQEDCTDLYPTARARVSNPWLYLDATNIYITDLMTNQYPRIITIIAIRLKSEFDLDPEDTTYSSARKSILSCIVPPLGIIVACLPTLEPAIQSMFRKPALPSTAHNSIYDPSFARYWKATVLSGKGLEEPEMPLVGLTQPFMAKMSYLAPGNIQVTSHWEIHSSRGSARLDRSPVR